MTNTILSVKNLTMEFGGLKALDSIDIDVNGGEIVALIGPNGAGKTTFFNCITGIYAPGSGEIMAAGPGENKVSLNGLKPNLVTEKGLARTFQNIRLFSAMTAVENAMVARHCRSKVGIVGSILRTGTQKKIHPCKNHPGGFDRRNNDLFCLFLADTA